MKHICVIGAGVAGSVIALDLAQKRDRRVTLLDIDRLSDKYSKANKLELNIDDSSFLNHLQTTGYGYGGTSNLWHGVVTRLDPEDYDILNGAGSSLRSEIEALEPSLKEYFGDLANLEPSDHQRYNPFHEFIEINNFLEKQYIVKFLPTRFRELLKGKIKNTQNINLHLEQDSVAIRFLSESNTVSGLEYRKNGQTLVIEADEYVLCAGALETPRIILQSFEHSNIKTTSVGEGLMDHPSLILGELTLPKRILYQHHGKSSIFSPNTTRIGYRLPRHLRRNEAMNHSIFLRPNLDPNLADVRKKIRDLIYTKAGRPSINSLLNRNLFRAALGLGLEKSGLGYFTNCFLVTAQFEQLPKKENKVSISERFDHLGRRIPIIKNHIDEDLIAEGLHLSRLVQRSTKEHTRFTPLPFTLNDFFPGSHHSGTCPMGTDTEKSFIDINLKSNQLNNLYVCDASVLPKIGNANLTLTIASLAKRLASKL